MPSDSALRPRGPVHDPSQLTDPHVVPLALAFLAEIAMLAGLGWAGWSIGPNLPSSIGMMMLLPVSAAIGWGAWCAPKARWRLRTPARWALKVTMFAATFLLLLVSAPAPGAALYGTVMCLFFVVSLPADRWLLR